MCNYRKCFIFLKIFLVQSRNLTRAHMAYRSHSEEVRKKWTLATNRSPAGPSGLPARPSGTRSGPTRSAMEFRGRHSKLTADYSAPDRATKFLKAHAKGRAWTEIDVCLNHAANIILKLKFMFLAWFRQIAGLYHRLKIHKNVVEMDSFATLL